LITIKPTPLLRARPALGRRPAPGRALALAGLAAALGALPPAPAAAQVTDQLRREVDAVGVEERLGAAVPLAATFTDSDGRPLTLASLGGRPVLLTFNYTGCPRLCDLQLSGLARALRDDGWDGERYAVVTVSVDPAEALPALAAFKQERVREAGSRLEVARGWRFVTGAPSAVAALADAVGFKYRYEPRTGEFQHQATLVILTGDGRVSGYLHGIRYAPAALRAALERAGAGQVATAAEQASVGGFLLTCMGFDPADPAPLALKVMRAGGVAALAFLLSFLGLHALRGARHRRLRDPTP
jgi:protein SCO1/2